MDEPDPRRALEHDGKALNTASYAFLVAGVVFFVLGLTTDVLIIVLPAVGVLATLLLGRADQARWGLGHRTRWLVFALPGVVAFVPFVLRSTAGQGVFWVQLGFGVLWLLLYLSAVKAVTNDWGDILGPRR